MTQQPCRKDARVVDDEDIAGSQKRREIGNRAMFERSSAAIEGQQFVGEDALSDDTKARLKERAIADGHYYENV